MSNAIAEIGEKRKSFLSEVENDGVPQWQLGLPEHVDVKKFKQVVTAAVFANEKLLMADRRSLWQSCIKAAQEGLLPDGKEAALVPYKGKVQYQRMFMGSQKLMRQSGEVASIVARTVHEKDKFLCRYGDDETIEHAPFLDGDRGEVRMAYCIIKLKNGEVIREVLTRHDIDKIREASPSVQAFRAGYTKTMGPWGEWEEEMARKSALNRARKWAPSSTGIITDDEEPYIEHVDAFSPPEATSTASDFDPLEPPDFLDHRTKSAALPPGGGQAGEGNEPPPSQPAPNSDEWEFVKTYREACECTQTEAQTKQLAEDHDEQLKALGEEPYASCLAAWETAMARFEKPEDRLIP